MGCGIKGIAKMLAARDQENLVHAQQTAGAAKPLNQGVRQLPPKTPSAKAPKTPFKVPLNDENAIRAFKGVGKGNDIQTAGRKFGLVNSNAFITPIGTFIFSLSRIVRFLRFVRPSCASTTWC